MHIFIAFKTIFSAVIFTSCVAAIILKSFSATEHETAMRRASSTNRDESHYKNADT